MSDGPSSVNLSKVMAHHDPQLRGKISRLPVMVEAVEAER